MYIMLVEGFQKLWGKINNPSSGSPDVSIGDILTLMAKILSEYDNRNLEPIDKWVLAYLNITNGSAKMDIVFSWQDAAIGPTYGMPFDELEKRRHEESKNINKAVKKLINSKLIKLESEKLCLV
jgi:hypothetical protein